MGGLQQLALRPHRHVFPGAHRQRSGQQAGDAGEQDGPRVDTGGADAQHQRQVADEAVVGAEHRRPERPGQLLPAPRRQASQHLAVDPLVGRHGLAGIGVGLVRGAALRALHQGEHEHGAEVSGQKDQQPGTQTAARRRLGVLAEQVQPVRLVPLLRVGQGQQDLSFLTGLALAELAVAGGLGALVGQVLPPAANLTGGTTRGGRSGHLYSMAMSCSRDWVDWACSLTCDRTAGSAPGTELGQGGGAGAGRPFRGVCSGS